MSSFHIPSKVFSLKREELSDARVVLVTKIIWFCSIFFIKIYKDFKVNI